jgi:hypothetical protein
MLRTRLLSHEQEKQNADGKHASNAKKKYRVGIEVSFS